MLKPLDLFGPAPPKPRAKPVLREGAALVEVMLALKVHPAVAWHQRANSGAFKVGTRFVRFGWPGCPDLLGQMVDGRFLAVEVKAPDGKLRPEQAAFIALVRMHGGVAFVARNLADVRRELALATYGARLGVTRLETGP